MQSLRHAERIFRDCPAKTPPKFALPMCGFLRVLFLLELLVFTADLLRPPLEFSSPRTDFPTWEFPDFFRIWTPKAAKILNCWLSLGSLIFRQIPLSSEIPLALDNCFGKMWFFSPYYPGKMCFSFVVKPGKMCYHSFSQRRKWWCTWNETHFRSL